jgi:hypothetical protein
MVHALAGAAVVLGVAPHAAGCGSSKSSAVTETRDASVDAKADVPLIKLPPRDSGTDSGPPPPPPVCQKPTTPTGTWFNEITTTWGLGSATAPTYLGAILYAADLDNDGYSDVLTSDGTSTRATMGVMHHHLLMNRPDPADATKRTFVDTYMTSGLDSTSDGMGGRGYTIVVIGDLDNDGDNDIITCPGDPTDPDPCTALMNDGTAHFTPAPASALNALAATDYEGGTLLDYDADGVLDFWAGPRSGDGGPPYYPPALMHGNGDGTFTNVSAKVGLPTVNGSPAASTSFRQTLGVTACDLDGDGDLDVLLSDYGREHNQVWRNNGDGTFTEIGVSVGLASDNITDYTKNDQSYLCYCQANQCADLTINGNETDVDCGGGSCPSCSIGQHCDVTSDCGTNVCAHGVCSVATCADGTLDGSETDIDCGGGSCVACSANQKCLVAADCLSGLCTGGTCAALSCSGSTKSGSESDVGCGGPECPACATGKACNAASDCTSGYCDNSVCATAYCAKDVPLPVDGICPDRGWTPGQDDQGWRLGGVNFSFVCGDIDNDGDNDVFITTIHHWDVGIDEDPSELIVNNTPPGMPLQPFTRPGDMVTGLYQGPLEINDNFGDLSAWFADFDNDGMMDVYMLESDYPDNSAWLWRQTSPLNFTDVSMQSGIGQPELHGVTVTDLDNDGDLDVVVGTSTARSVEPMQAIRAFENVIGQSSNWLQLSLEGLGKGHSNRNAIGARVKVTAGGVTQMQEVKGGFGLNAMQGGYVLTFGLGTACSIDSLEIRWPDGKGTTQTFTGVEPNYRIKITEGADRVVYPKG